MGIDSRITAQPTATARTCLRNKEHNEREEHEEFH